MTSPNYPKNINPRGPTQKYPGSSETISNDPKHSDQSHQNSDLNSSIFAQHHNLGPNPNQASPGNHNHDGSTSKQFTDLDLLGILTAGNFAWGQVTIVPVPNTPTSAPVSFNLKGSTFVGFTTANSGVPGTTVLATSINGISATGATVWIDRINNTATGVYWLVIGI